MADIKALKAKNPLLNTIRVKTNVVIRLAKERISYLKEVEQENQKLKVMEETPDQDVYILRKQRSLCQESSAMVADCDKRLQKALQDLENTLKLAKAEDFESTEYVNATSVLNNESHNLLKQATAAM